MNRVIEKEKGGFLMRIGIHRVLATDNVTLWCDKKSHSYSVAFATSLDAKTISVRNCKLGNRLVGCMRKCGNKRPVHGLENC